MNSQSEEQSSAPSDPQSSQQQQQETEPTTIIEDLTPEPAPLPQPPNGEPVLLGESDDIPRDSNNNPVKPVAERTTSTISQSVNSTNESVSSASASKTTDDDDDLLEIHIKNPVHREETTPFTMMLPVDTTIGTIKQRLSTTYPGNPAPERQRLIYAGRILPDNLTLSVAVPPSIRNLHPRHTFHLVVRSDQTHTPTTPPQSNNTNIHPPNPPRAARPNRIPPPNTQAAHAPTVTYAERLNLLRSLIARIVQIDRDAGNASLSQLTPGLQRNSQITQIRTESSVLLRQVEEQAQLLRMLLYTPDYYTRHLNIPNVIGLDETNRGNSWLDPAYTRWNLEQQGRGFTMPFAGNNVPPGTVPHGAPAQTPNPPNNAPITEEYTRFFNMRQQFNQQHRQPLDNRFAQHRHVHHHHHHLPQDHVHIQTHPIHHHLPTPGVNQPPQPQNQQQQQQPGPDQQNQNQNQDRDQAQPQPQELPIQADEFRRLIMDNLAVLMQQNPGGNPPADGVAPPAAPQGAGVGIMANANINANDPNAPVVRQFVFQFEIDWSLILKLLFIIYLFAQGGSPRRVYTLSVVAFTAYLWHRGYLTFLPRLLQTALPSPRNVIDSLFPVRQQATDGQPVVREQSRFGRLSLVFTFIYAFIYGLVCSLLPGWTPEPLPRANEIIPPAGEANQEQPPNDNQEPNQGEGVVHAHAD